MRLRNKVRLLPPLIQGAKAGPFFSVQFTFPDHPRRERFAPGMPLLRYPGDPFERRTSTRKPVRCTFVPFKSGSLPLERMRLCPSPEWTIAIGADVSLSFQGWIIAIGADAPLSSKGGPLVSERLSIGWNLEMSLCRVRPGHALGVSGVSPSNQGILIHSASLYGMFS